MKTSILSNRMKLGRILFTLISLSILGCSGTSTEPLGPDKAKGRVVGFLEFKLDNIQYRIEADSIYSSAEFENTPDKHVLTDFGSETPVQVSSLHLRLKDSDTLNLGKYVIPFGHNPKQRSFSLVYVGRGITISGGTLFGDCEIEFIKLESKSKGQIEGAFNMKNVKVQQGSNVSQTSTITEGKFSIRTD